MSLTFDKFKSYFEFSIEVAGVSGAIGTLLYRLDVVRSLWRVASGSANSNDENVASSKQFDRMEALRKRLSEKWL